MARWGGTGGIIALIDRGTDIDTKSKDGDTPLHLAISYGQTEIAFTLIDRGADIHAKTNGGLTPLHFAAFQGQIETATVLIDRGADVNDRVDAYKTPADFAKQSRKTEMLNLLKAHGGEITNWRRLRWAGYRIFPYSSTEKYPPFFYIPSILLIIVSSIVILAGVNLPFYFWGDTVSFRVSTLAEYISWAGYSSAMR